MCGIAGVISSRSSARDELGPLAARMASAIAHRGPDDAGAWVDAGAGVALGHRRLSIIDLSAAGHQPMESASGRLVVALNGEIYNHLALRSELEAAGAAPPWRGHSDTETLLAAFDHWGVEPTLSRTVGMFAIALWDKASRTLHLARDRFGEKPLYYGWAGSDFVFGSELKALRAHPGFSNRISREALAQYLRFMYVPAPRSIYEGVYKLEPGCLLSVRAAGAATRPSQPLRPPFSDGSLALGRWWSLSQLIEDASRHPLHDENEALELLNDRLKDAVRLQSLADVPLGAFLSGGIDSSTIVALMQEQASRPVKTFTVGFEEAGFDESPHARAVAAHLGTEHTELFVTSEEARNVIAQLPAMYDEPFADSSQIPTHLVCRAARQHVTVAVSGDGGDELFGGYTRHFWAPRLWNRLSWIPYGTRRALGTAIAALPVTTWDALAKTFGLHGLARVGAKAHKLADCLDGVHTLDDLYLNLVSEWRDPASFVCSRQGEVQEPLSILGDPLPTSGVKDGRARMMYRDSVTYLPDDILCKVDRAAMAVSLETRVPFLDHRVAEVAWRLPITMKIQGARGKVALRRILDQRVPRALIDRPKAGFAIPVGAWLRGPLREWAESLFEQRRLEREGHLDPAPVHELWQEHLSGRRDWTPRLWSVLMFQAWNEAAR